MNDPQFERLLSKLELARRQYADLLDLLREIPGSVATDDGANNWAGPLRDWWSQNRDTADPEAAAVYEKLVEHGRILFDLSQRLDQLRRGGRGGKAHREVPVLLEEFQRSLFNVLDNREIGDAGLFSPMGHLVGMWRHHAEALFGMSGTLLAAFPDADRPLDEHRLREMLVASNRGFAPPKMDRSVLMELMGALADHQMAFNRFARLLAEAAVTAVSRMESSIGREKNTEPRGARDLYADWLDCCESVYDEIARDEDFADSLCRLVDSAVRVGAARRALASHAAATMELSSAAVVRELARSLQDTRRRLRRLERTPPADLADRLRSAPAAIEDEPAVAAKPGPSSLAATNGDAGESPDPSKPRCQTKAKRAVKKKKSSGKKSAGKKKVGVAAKTTPNP